MRLADEIMQGVGRAGGEGDWRGLGGGLTERSQSLLLINHCSVFDLSFAKGAKRGGGGWPLLLTLPRKEGGRGRARENAGEEAKKKRKKMTKRLCGGEICSRMLREDATTHS